MPYSYHFPYHPSKYEQMDTKITEFSWGNKREYTVQSYEDAVIVTVVNRTLWQRLRGWVTGKTYSSEPVVYRCYENELRQAEQPTLKDFLNRVKIVDKDGIEEISKRLQYLTQRAQDIAHKVFKPKELVLLEAGANVWRAGDDRLYEKLLEKLRASPNSNFGRNVHFLLNNALDELSKKDFLLMKNPAFLQLCCRIKLNGPYNAEDHEKLVWGLQICNENVDLDDGLKNQLAAVTGYFLYCEAVLPK